MLENLKPVARTSLSDRIVDQLTDLITRGVLKPGGRVPSEKELCRQFGVGRTSVREALRSLSVMGILESHAGDGTFVSGDATRYLERTLQWGLLFDRKVVEDLIETRVMLESETAYLAARKATPEDLNEIEHNVRGMEKSVGVPDRYLEFDLQFHLAIARATQNSILFHLLSLIRGCLQAWIKETLAGPTAHDSRQRAILSITEHQKVLRALREGRAEEARQAMTEHIFSSSADLQEHLKARA
jgi:GntR family transcriptional repressor for pyruvate dehydrogenase complex